MAIKENVLPLAQDSGSGYIRTVSSGGVSQRTAFDTVKGAITADMDEAIADEVDAREAADNQLQTEIDGKVDKVTGKGLSTNDFTNALKTKLDGIEAGAEVNIIETVKVNGTALVPDANRAVNVPSPTVDSALSTTSTNPVQNKVITCEITDLKEDITELGLPVLSVTNNRFISATGRESQSEAPNYNVIYYDVSKCDNCEIRVKANVDSTSTRWAFYDYDDVILSIISPTYNSDDFQSLTVPTSAYRLGVSVLKSNSNESIALIPVSKVIDKITGSINDIYDATFEPALIPNKYVDYLTGEIVTYNDWSTTDYIDISSYDKLLIYSPSTNKYVAFYDINMDHIEYVAATMDFKAGLNYYSIPVNAVYYRYSQSNAKMAEIKVFTHYGELNTKVNKLDGEYLFALFNNVVCIGDSLTRGYRSEYPEGSKNADYGYPEYLAHMSNTTIANYGQSGDTPTDWYNFYGNTDFSSYDCAIICFGRNDYLTSETDRTNYQNIIDKLQNENPHMTIFILSLPPSGSDFSNTTADGKVINQKIKTIADNNNLPYIDIWTYSSVRNSSYRSDSTHYYTLGYVMIAKDVLDGITTYINNNQSEFMQVWVPSTKPPYPPAQ